MAIINRKKHKGKSKYYDRDWLNTEIIKGIILCQQSLTNKTYKQYVKSFIKIDFKRLIE